MDNKQNLYDLEYKFAGTTVQSMAQDKGLYQFSVELINGLSYASNKNSPSVLFLWLGGKISLLVTSTRCYLSFAQGRFVFSDDNETDEYSYIDILSSIQTFILNEIESGHSFYKEVIEAYEKFKEENF